MLTRRQADLLRYLIAYERDGDGCSPSFDQMRDALGLKAKSGIHRLITGLEERGFIERLPYQARSIRVIQEPNKKPAPTVDNLRLMVAGLCAEHGPEITVAALVDLARDIVVVVPRAA